MGVYIGEPIEVSDMQGPCPDGFHVPTNTEWSAVYSIGINLGLWTSRNGNGVKTYLKLPFMGTRQYTNGATNRQGSEVVYWCCDSHSSYTGYANTLYASSTLMESSHYNQKALGAGIRPFKDSAVTPSGSGWTALYSNRVYWNSSLGLISISSDGSTWYTLADKNVGATTVYNDGDTLSEANCGKYYQWGNNYGFPYIGSITTSSTQVDASTYGPGNYYSSSTFILINGGWDSSDNKNLRGGVSQGTSIKSVLKNAYIGEYVEPGIYHNATLGLISLSSDGTTRITIADKNLGATNVGDYGNYYQWGNNYGWATNATTKSSSQVDAGNYGPGNYYNSSTFITGKAGAGWDSSNNSNLRGGTTGTVEAMQGPCPSGYHIPSYPEFSSLSTLLFTTFGLSKNGGTLNTYLKLPANGYIGEDGNIAAATQGQFWYYFSSTNVVARNAFGVYATDSGANLVTGAAKALGQGIRPFKNEALQPDSSRTKLY